MTVTVIICLFLKRIVTVNNEAWCFSIKTVLRPGEDHLWSRLTVRNQLNINSVDFGQ